MKTKLIVTLVFFTLVWGQTGWSQADYPWLRTGDELYKRGTFNDAETSYRKALVEKERPTTNFNLGNTVYHQNRIPEAVQQYEKAIESTSDPELKSSAYYNLGNAHFQNQAYEESIKAYKESLKLQPDDEDAKRNLMLAMRQYQQQQQKEQEKNEGESKENQDQQQPQPQDEEKEEENQDSNSQSQSQPNEDQQKPPENVSEEEAREILKAIEREDQRVQEKLKKSAGKTAPPLKDW